MTRVVEALKDIIKQELSGQLIIRDALDPSITWEAYFGNGKLHFATSTVGQKERLTYLTRHHHPDFNLSEFTVGQSDYKFICHQWQSGRLSLQQVRQLAFTSTQEAFVHIMAIGNAEMEFNLDAHLDVLILSTSVQQAIAPVKQLIWQWQKIRPHITSPLVRVYLSNIDSLYKLLWQQLQSTKAIESYQAALTQNLCLYSTANQLNIDVQELSHMLLPLVRNRSAQISTYGQKQDEERPLIACIDDSQTVQNSVKLTLEAQGYEVISLLKPAQAMTKLIRTHPMLILMDISMPDINGYELCQLLRKSPSFKHVPILMLSSRDGLFDKLKAKMVGADDYMTKPFTPTDLVNLVNKYVSQALVNV
ncbi:response regulator [Chamaesiphon sp. OTE_8_metabat_110]|uniref:response regulator n=1 Tax=Chamaesiphon sp. OTE_8_metabat_110 TaxID=2964696 RepID=UPI00286AE6FD|nr:response regulator [Chamaesiphon sp. OTE_8_metabat_110]